jgi:hypothetical protein
MSDGVSKIPENVSDAEWKHWVATDGQELIGLGIPEIILSREYLWGDFLAHGLLEYHPEISGFSVADIKPAARPRLLEILLASYPKSTIGECDLVLILWRAVKPNEDIWESD